MNDDGAARGGAPIVHHKPVEHVGVTRARGKRGRAESRHDQVRAADTRQRHEQRLQWCEGSCRQRPSVCSDRRKQRRQQQDPRETRQPSRSLHSTLPFVRGAVFIRVPASGVKPGTERRRRCSSGSRSSRTRCWDATISLRRAGRPAPEFLEELLERRGTFEHVEELAVRMSVKRRAGNRRLRQAESPSPGPRTTTRSFVDHTIPVWTS